MDYKNLDLPVPYHPTFDVIDSTKIKTFLTSPRRYFYEYILGLRSEEPNVHLIFGSAWHKAMEVFSNNVGRYLDDEVMEQACDAFTERYREDYPDPLTDFDNGNKTLANAVSALVQYAATWKRDDFEVLWTEIAGTVPVSPERVLHFKMDTVFRDKEGDVWSLEHKTASRRMQTWETAWGTSPQVWTYTHALRAWLGKEAKGVKINGAIIRDKSCDFVRIPVRKSNDMMQVGLEFMNHVLDQIDWNMLRLAEDKADARTMYSFPCNADNCHGKFGMACPFHDFCNLEPNPIRRFHERGCPSGMRIEHWDPRRGEETAKKVIHLEGV
jgi:hypothetical protein